MTIDQITEQIREQTYELLDTRAAFHEVPQTRRHSWEALPADRGDCHRAALASLLGMALDEVADHAGAHSPADHFWYFGRRWLRSLGMDICAFHAWGLEPGWLGLGTVPSLNASGAWHTVVVEVLDAASLKVVWDPAQWPGRPNFNGRILPVCQPGQLEPLLVDAICDPYDPSPDQLLASGALGAGT